MHYFNILLPYLKSKFSYLLRSFTNWLNFWQFCLVFGFILGFTISFSLQFEYNFLLVISIFLVIFLVTSLTRRKFYLLIFLIGLFLGFWHRGITINNINDRVTILLNNNDLPRESTTYKGLIITNKQEKDFYSYIDVLLTDNTQVRLQIPKYEDLKYLQTIEFYSTFNLPEEKINDFYYRNFLFSKNIYLIGKEVEIKNKYFDSILSNLVSEFKSLVEKTINLYINEPYSAITSAILIGNKNDIPKDVNEIIRDIGISHILVVSGMHFVIFLNIFVYLSNKINIHRKFAFVFILFLSFFYYLLVGIANIPTQRAFLGFLLVAISILFGRRHLTFLIISFVVFLQIFNNPFIFNNISFLLTTTATLALSVQVLKYNYNLNNNLLKTLISYIKINIFVSPIIFFTFKEISLISIISNILFTPLVPIIMLCGFVMFFLSFIPYLGTYFSEYLGYLINYIVKFMLDVGIKIQNSGFSTTSDAILFLIYLLALIFIVFLYDYFKFILKHKKSSLGFNSHVPYRLKFIDKISSFVYETLAKKYTFFNTKFILNYLILTSFLVYFLFKNFYFLIPSDPKVIFLNVGQGDSILIKTSNNKFGLIDTGPNKNVLYQLGQILPTFFRDIEFVVLTHPDKDHVEGIIHILDRYHVKKIFINKFQEKTDLFKYLTNKLLQRNIDTYYLTTNNDFKFGEFYFDVLWPQNYFNPNLSTNNSSISFKILVNNYMIYSFGDLESEFEIQVLSNINSQVNQLSKHSILKISHHGSKYSSSQELINYINPVFTIISVGKDNPYGHPSEEVINLLNKNDISIYRTDIHNNIILNF